MNRAERRRRKFRPNSQVWQPVFVTRKRPSGKRSAAPIPATVTRDGVTIASKSGDQR